MVRRQKRSKGGSEMIFNKLWNAIDELELVVHRAQLHDIWVRCGADASDEGQIHIASILERAEQLREASRVADPGNSISELFNDADSIDEVTASLAQVREAAIATVDAVASYSGTDSHAVRETTSNVSRKLGALAMLLEALDYNADRIAKRSLRHQQYHADASDLLGKVASHISRPPASSDATLTPADAAVLLHCTSKTVIAHCKSGKLRASNIGNGESKGRWVIQPADLKTFLDVTANRPATTADDPSPKRARTSPKPRVDRFANLP